MAALNDQISEQQKAEDDLNNTSRQIGSDIYSLQRKLAAERAATATAKAREARRKAATPTPAPTSTSNPRPGNHSWTWPVPSSHTITSYFGNRFHPVYHVYRFHAGIDISAPFGSAVVAARSGTVLMVVNPVQGSNYGGYGYGNYIVIDHGDGISTLYGHMKQTLVRPYQTVSAGDRIGLVGSTGTSTGAHLHFEVRINGDPVNPLNYVG
jgi:murein DD-endopeptidase MepM/ murein hydrolase activator NlpD